MAVYKFTEAIQASRPVEVYAEGNLLRDFTFIDDIINGILSVLEKQKTEEPPVLMNIGNNNPVTVNILLSEIEQAVGRKAVVKHLPMQPGDVEKTYADISLINAYCGFKPVTGLNTGIQKFCEWYLGYFANFHN